MALDHMPPGQERILENGLGDTKSVLKVSLRARTTKWVINTIRPSFLTRRPRKQLAPTAYLDGLRGFAAFLVYWQHHQVWARVAISSNNIFENAYGYDNQYYFACLPGIRIFFTGGHVAVAVFFVISGHVLSSKPLLYVYSRDYGKLGENVASALFRRWLRLHIPALCVTFLYMTTWHVFGIWTAYPDHQSTYFEEMRHWYTEFKNFSFVFRTGGDPWFTYNFHLWSIPVEFRGSVVVYTTHLALSKFKRNMRLFCEMGLIFYFLYMVDGWFCAMFVAGLFLCDLDLLARKDDLPDFLSFPKLEPYKALFWCALFVSGIYLSGVPASRADLEIIKASPGWYYLSFLKSPSIIDPKWFYLFWAATFIVASIPHIHWLKRFFETPFCQYLGTISFALYLVHGPILWTLSDRLYAATGWTRDFRNDGLGDWANIFPMSKAGPLGLEPSFLVPHLIILPVTFWLAEIVTRLFDEPSVRFSHWTYRRSLTEDDELVLAK
jgi:peptidoglycan/LPS O-acetylase OafA/YrhL